MTSPPSDTFVPTDPETPPNEQSMRQRLVLLTGMSGAGLSTALKAFEDIGYEAVDNLRIGLIPLLLKESTSHGALAIAIDTRNPNFTVEDMLAMLNELGEKPDLHSEMVFLECSDETLQRRFSETRRRHPLAIDRPVTDGIKREREILWKLKDVADHVWDTSLMSIHDLRRMIAGQFRLDHAQGLTIFVTSFSFRHGVPREADLVFDARFLNNPHWDPKLRPLCGTDEVVANFIRKDNDYDTFLKNLKELIVPLLPRFLQEGKSYLTIAIGCTGGKHRSVLVAEDLANILAIHGYIVGIGHRDMER